MEMVDHSNAGIGCKVYSGLSVALSRPSLKCDIHDILLAVSPVRALRHSISPDAASPCPNRLFEIGRGRGSYLDLVAASWLLKLDLLVHRLQF
jgi:hypothetical protein